MARSDRGYEELLGLVVTALFIVVSVVWTVFGLELWNRYGMKMSLEWTLVWAILLTLLAFIVATYVFGFLEVKPVGDSMCHRMVCRAMGRDPITGEPSTGSLTDS